MKGFWRLVLVPSYFCLSSFLMIVSHGSPTNITYNDSKIINNLNLGYDVRLRPDHKGTPTNIKFDMKILAMRTSNNIAYELELELVQRWVDPRLAFDISHPEQVISIDKKFYFFWFPGTIIENLVDSSISKTSNQDNSVFDIYGDGSVANRKRIVTEISFQEHNGHFPLDKQRVKLAIRSYKHSVGECIYKWEKALQVSDIVAPLPRPPVATWALQHASMSSRDENPITLELVFQRIISKPFFEVFLPAALLVTLSWISFWIDETNFSLRFVVTASSFFCLVIFGAMRGSSSSGNDVYYLTALDVYMLICLIFTFASIFQVSVVREENVECFQQTPILSKVKWNKMDVSEINRKSRIVYPLIFAFFQISYWLILVIIRASY